MAKGDIKKLKFESFYDSESNNEVIRLTPTDILCHRNYFYQKCFTRILLFSPLYYRPFHSNGAVAKK